MRRREGTTLFVSNEVGLGIVPDTPLGRLFRDLAGRCNQEMAAAADSVVFLVSGLPLSQGGIPMTALEEIIASLAPRTPLPEAGPGKGWGSCNHALLGPGAFDGPGGGPGRDDGLPPTPVTRKTVLVLARTTHCRSGVSRYPRR